MSKSKPKGDVVQYEIKNHVATIWINRPHVKNCVNPEVLDKLGEYARTAEADENVRAVVFRGRGNTFCAGADLGELLTPFCQFAARQVLRHSSRTSFPTYRR